MFNFMNVVLFRLAGTGMVILKHVFRKHVISLVTDFFTCWAFEDEVLGD